jgi:hypothetical protein
MKDLHIYKTIFCANCGYAHRVRLNCGDRLCPLCKKPNYYRLLHKYIPVISKISSSKLQQITLTHRNFLYLTKSKVDLIVSDLKKLRKTDLFKNQVRGGLAVVETKHVNDRVGWNLHIHILVDADFIPQKQLSKVWLGITGNAFIVDIRNTGNRPKSSIYHLLKYFLKTPVIRGADESQLKIDFNNAFRGSRNVITFGSLYNVYDKDQAEEYHFKCPVCHHTDWLMDFELFTLERGARCLKVGYG